MRNFTFRRAHVGLPILAHSPLLLLLLGAGPLASTVRAETKADDGSEPKFTNRLAEEKSPYLKQHQHNPVDWYPWGDEAFELARKENKPVFLSIGYATCHWCHVMERESFEDEETAKLMNELFVCVKLDREERPDIDRIYMNFHQAMYGGGGWPLNIWMTADRIPFGSGTYFPPVSQGGRPSFSQVCRQINGHWTQNGAQIQADPEATRAKLQEMLSRLPESASDGFKITPAILDTSFDKLAERFDAAHGGFGGAPKFPQPDQIDFLLQYHLDTSHPDDQRQQALEMATATLNAMAQGGIRDHLGGGFHRYSVDEFWHIPHFEKMLYDQAQLARSLLTVHQITGAEEPAKVAREVLDYVIRDLGHEGGAFFCAEDADSYENDKSDHKTEGAFYVWTDAELVEALGEDEADLFRKAYGVKADGNVRPDSDPHGELTGKNHFFQQTDAGALAQLLGTDVASVETRLAASRQKLFELRATRIRPIRDDKILTAWNGLMISALAHASRALGDDAYLDRANRAADFLLENLRDKDGNLLRSWLDGPSTIPATAADYSHLVGGLLDLYDASLDPARIAQAVELQDTMNELLLDTEAGGFFDAAETQTDLIIRLKDFEDGVQPAANSQAAMNLMRLYGLLHRDDYAAIARGIFKAAAPLFEAAPHATLRLVEALRLDLAPPAQILVAATDPASAEARAILEIAQSSPISGTTIALITPGMTGPMGASDQITARTAIAGKPTLYLCRNFTCQMPTNEPEKIRAMIDKALSTAKE